MTNAVTGKPAAPLASQVAGFGILILLVAALPLWLAIGALYVLWLGTFHLVVWMRHPTFVVFVYSDSPKWKCHVEEEILPTLPVAPAVLNWSEKQHWHRTSLAAHAFMLFGGSKAYCPMAIVFRRGRWVRTFRFFKPFQAAKHGDQRCLVELQEQLVQCAGGVV